MRGRDAPPESEVRLGRAARGARHRLTEILTLRLDPETLARVDAIAAERSTDWRTVTRSDVLRDLLREGLSGVALRAPRPRHPTLTLVRSRSSSVPTMPLAHVLRMVEQGIEVPPGLEARVLKRLRLGLVRAHMPEIPDADLRWLARIAVLRAELPLLRRMPLEVQARWLERLLMLRTELDAASTDEQLHALVFHFYHAEADVKDARDTAAEAAPPSGERPMLGPDREEREGRRDE